MISAKVIQKEEDFRLLKDKLNDVLNRSLSNHFFLTWEWLFYWWESFKLNDDRLSIVLVMDNDQIVAIAPFMIRKTNYYGFNLYKLCFIGEGNSDRSDVFSIRNDDGIFEKLFECICDEVTGWDIMYFREIPEESYFLAYAKKNYGGVDIEEDSLCPYIPIEPDLEWDTFYKSLSKKLRRDFSNKYNRLKNLGTYEYDQTLTKEGVNYHISDIREIERLSSKAMKAVELVFDEDDKMGFQQKLIDNSGREYKVLLTLLKLDGQIIAYLYGFIYNNKYYAYNTAYLPEYRNVSAGKLLINESIKFVIENKYREFDFLRGSSYLKSKWTNKERKQIHLIVFRDSWKNSFIQFLLFKVRPLVKRIKASVISRQMKII